MKEVPVEKSVGMVLGHDITEIIKDKFKGPRFKKGHIIKEEDIPILKKIGKKNIYIFELEEGMIHEDQAAEYLRDMCMGKNMYAKGPSEGKFDVFSELDGLLKVDIERLLKINIDPQMMVASRHNNMPVRKDDKIFGTRIIPLVIEKEKMEFKKAEIGREAIFNILPFIHQKIGLITTGSEIFSGLIKDTFSPVVKEKVKKYNLEVTEHVLVSDDSEDIEREIKKMLDKDVDIIILTGGMSVDPDDKTPKAITNVSKNLVTYGAPVLPGAMFCLGYSDEGKPIMGLPGCVMYERSTIFDIILPRIAAKDLVKAEEIARLGHGGLCLQCRTCTYPECSFGKGV
ncbi:molybdopterin-binding protein [Peptoniphilus porci]|uniref:Molybdopterin molybdenumtransferase n=1 Tax=Peptoniphilus porci TaxID=2652280 RepID=A0A1U7LYT6_9FIRM|nr:molybdopterin-binding protein [Peptoniphilus porci]OLR64591.1 molybdopterin-binding protein [Peptoniphilus porci]